jgi:aminoglycoside phosphotransferase (APT) family kinase protein/molybdopterin converting factor small subunit
MGLLRSLVRPRSGTKIRVRVLIRGRIGAGWHDVDRTFRLAPGATLAELLPAADRAGVPLSEAISNSPHLRDTLMINGERCPLEDNRDRELHEGDEIYLLAPVAGGSGAAWEKDSFEGRLDRVLRREIADCERLASIERLSGGASQETYRLRIETPAGLRALALRRSQGGKGEEARAVERSAPGLRIEAKLMQVARRNGIPEPEVFYVLESGDDLGAGFVMEWLDGIALGARIVRSTDLAEVRPKLARQCGEILGRLHTIDLEAHGLDRDLASLSASDFIEQTRGRYEALDTPQPMIDFTARWLMENLPDSPDRTLVHNDFRNGNLMVDQSGVSAVLDWEIAHIGDPMRDLGWICTNSWRYGAGPELPVGGFGTYEDLFAGYEATSGKTVELARVQYWEVFGSFWWAVSTLGMTQHYRQGLDRSVERVTIGRRTTECQVDCVNLLIPGPVELVAAPEQLPDPDMPRLEELVGATRDFLHGQVRDETTGRTRFHALVAGNALDIVYRDLHFGDEHRRREHERLRRLLEADGSLLELRWKLVHAIRDDRITLDDGRLHEHLRATVVNQIAIDQPKYSGFKTAATRAERGTPGL